MGSEVAHAGAELPWKCSSRVAVLGVEPEGTQGPSTLALGCGIGMRTLGSQGGTEGSWGRRYREGHLSGVLIDEQKVDGTQM